jgi:hypothetical protein
MTAFAPLLVGLALLVQGQQPATRPASGPATRPAPPQNRQQDQDPETPQAIRASILREIEQLKATLPIAAPASAAELLSARLMNGFLLVELRQAPEQSPILVPFKDRPDAVARITIARPPRAIPEAESPPTQRFMLIYNSPGAADSDIAITRIDLFVGAPHGQLNMSMDRVWLDDRRVNVQLIQLPSGLEDQQRLAIHVSQFKSDDDEGIYASIQADNFVELARDEPEIYAEFVVPMLAELGLAGVLDSDLRDVALQAFLQELPVDDATQRRVRELVARLDSAEFADREAAQKQIQELGRPGATALAKIAAQGELTPEQVSRVRDLLSPYAKLTDEEIEARLKSPDFLRAAAALDGDEDLKAVARLARQRLESLGEGASTRPVQRQRS